MLKNVLYNHGLSCLILNNRFRPIYPPNSKTDPTERKPALVKVQQGGSEKGGQQGYTWSSLAPCTFLVSLSYVEEWGWRGVKCADREQNPSGAPSRWKEYHGWVTDPHSSLSTAQPQNPASGFRSRRGQRSAVASRPSLQGSWCASDIASVACMFKRNGWITYHTLWNGKHKNKDNFHYLSSRFQDEFKRPFLSWTAPVSILIETIFSRGELTYIHIYSQSKQKNACFVYISTCSGNIYGKIEITKLTSIFYPRSEFTIKTIILHEILGENNYILPNYFHCNTFCIFIMFCPWILVFLHTHNLDHFSVLLLGTLMITFSVILIFHLFNLL